MNMKKEYINPSVMVDFICPSGAVLSLSPGVNSDPQNNIGED